MFRFFKKFSNIVYFLCLISIFSYTAWFFAKPFVLKPISIENNLQIQIGYENTEHDIFAIQFERNKNNENLSFTFGNAGDEKILNIPIPYTKSKDFYIYFGKEGNIVKIADIKINDKTLPLENLYQSLYKQGFKVGKLNNDESIYLQSKGENTYRFEFSDLLEYLSDEQLYEIESSSPTLSLSLLALIFFASLLLIIVCTKLFRSQLSKNTFLYLSSLFFIIFIIHGFCLIMGYNFIFGFEEASDYFLNFLKFESNHLPLIIFILLPAVIAILFKNWFIKLFLFLLTFILIFILGLDNFVSSTFGTRLLLRSAGDFTVDFATAIPFAENYFSSSKGFIAIFSAFLLICFFVRFFSSNLLNKKCIVSIYSVGAILSLFFAFWPFPYSDCDIYYANVFQVNHITTTSLGDYQTPFSEDYPYRKNLDYEWKTLQGLGRKENVIVILVESLNCDLTKMCGNDSATELMPNLSKLANNSLFFDNYYSDSFSTSMAVLSITKHVPAFPQRSVKEEKYAQDKFIKELLQQNDLLSAFSKGGYKTAFFSSTDLLFRMDDNLKLTHFDDVYDSDSEIFDKKDQKYIFHSVSDEILFDKILDYVKSNKKEQLENNGKKLFLMTKTVGSHVPFTSPWGSQNFDNSFLYTDYAIDKFLKDLEKQHYFDDGIVVLTGDHQPWGFVKSRAGESLLAKNHVPLIVIDKKQGVGVNHTQFSHSSLGVYLQSIMLDTYKLNKFNADPTNSDKPGLVLTYEYDKYIFALVKSGDKEARIRFNGDKTEFLTKIFDDDYEHDVLGYLASLSL